MKHTTFLLVSAVLFFSACKQSKEPVKAESTDEIAKLPPTEVKVEVLERRVFNQEIVSNGKLEAHTKAELQFKTNGIIREIKVKNGQYVRKGELIAKLDNFESQNVLERSRIGFETARIQLIDHLIGQGYELSDSADIPPEVFETAKIRSGYLRAKNEYALAKYNYESTILLAPVAGVIANLHAKENTYPIGNEPFCIVVDLNSFEIKFPIMESEISIVETGQKVNCIAFYNKNIEVRGIVSSVNPIVDKNGLIEVIAFIQSPKTKLFEGMNIKVFVKKPLKEKLVVPKKAVTLRTERQVVFVYENGLAKWNYVETGSENNEFLTIEEGLSEGDSVITEGNVHLGHDAEVIIK